MMRTVLDTVGQLRQQAGRARSGPFVWGFVSQAASSVTNFGLSLLAARALGPSGLGAVFIGFAVYLTVVGFQRALITNPLVSRSSALEPRERTAAARAALLASICFAGATTVIVGLLGVLLPDNLGLGFLLFTPWLIPVLVQDFWRVTLFRDGRGDAGAINDTLWLVVMALTAPLAFALATGWAVVACWGLGGFAGMVAGFAQTRMAPAAPGPAARWWASQAWPFGRWLAAENVIHSIGSQAFVFILALILDTRSIGGIRAVETVFTPLSVLGPALALPGLPALTRKLAVSWQQARALAARLSAALLILTSTYVVLAVSGGGRLLSRVFGGPFGEFEALMWPIGIGQMLVAPTLGFTFLLIAQGRGKAMLATAVVRALASMTLGVGLANAYGVVGAAWGIALVAVLAGVTSMVLALSKPGAATGSGAPSAEGN